MGQLSNIHSASSPCSMIMSIICSGDGFAGHVNCHGACVGALASMGGPHHTGRRRCKSASLMSKHQVENHKWFQSKLHRDMHWRISTPSQSHHLISPHLSLITRARRSRPTLPHPCRFDVRRAIIAAAANSACHTHARTHRWRGGGGHSCPRWLSQRTVFKNTHAHSFPRGLDTLTQDAIVSRS